VLHLGYAALWGALVALAPRPLRRSPAFGAAYGVVVWLVNFGGIVPGLRVASPFWRAPRGQNATGLVAHAVFGAVTSLALRDFAERPTPADPSGAFRRSVSVA
jgi:hypothetical protein